MNIQKSKPILVFLKGTLQQVQQRWLRLSRRSGDPKFPRPKPAPSTDALEKEWDFHDNQ